MRRRWGERGEEADEGGSGRRGRTVRRPREMVPMNLQMVAVVRDMLSDAQACTWKGCCRAKAD